MRKKRLCTQVTLNPKWKQRFVISSTLPAGRAPALSEACLIPRVRSPSFSDFKKNFFKKDKSVIIEGCTDAWPARLVSTLGEGEEGREEGGKGGRERGKRQSSMRERLGVEVCVCVCVCARARARKGSEAYRRAGLYHGALRVYVYAHV